MIGLILNQFYQLQQGVKIMSITFRLHALVDDFENMAKVSGDTVIINKGAYEAVVNRLYDLFVDAAHIEKIPLVLQTAVDVSEAGDNVIEFSKCRFKTKFKEDGK